MLLYTLLSPARFYRVDARMAHRLGQYVQLCTPIGRLGSVAGSAGALSVLSCQAVSISTARPASATGLEAYRVESTSMTAALCSCRWVR